MASIIESRIAPSMASHQTVELHARIKKSIRETGSRLLIMKGCIGSMEPRACKALPCTKPVEIPEPGLCGVCDTAVVS